jgi:hypothetical protein
VTAIACAASLPFGTTTGWALPYSPGSSWVDDFFRLMCRIDTTATGYRRCSA